MENQLMQIDDHIWAIDSHHDIIYSEDDEMRTGKGYYIEKVIEEGIAMNVTVSVDSYKTKEQAVTEFLNGNCEFKA